MINKILILIILPAILLSLRVTTDPRPSIYSSIQYERQLQIVQSQFQQRIDQLDKLMARIDQVIADESTQNSIKLRKITQQIADERDVLYNIQQKIKIPFQLKACEYEAIDVQKRQQFNLKLDDIEQKLQGLKNQLKVCKKQVCGRYDQLNKQSQQIQGYLMNIRQILNYDCRRKTYQFVEQQATGFVRIQNSLKKNNFKAKNWYYNVGGQQQYRLKLFQKSTKFNTTNCPIDKPYVNEQNNECFRCQDENAMYNINEMKCFSCKGTQYLNLKTSLCENCPQHNFYNNQLKRCDTCPYGQYFNDQNQQCQTCKTQQGQYFDQVQYKCKKCPNQQVYNTFLQICQNCKPQFQQFYNSTTYKCQSCPINNYYNVEQKKCQPCQGQTYFNKDQAICTYCPQNQQLNKITLSCQQCSQKQHYNSTIKTCIQCPYSTIFSQQDAKCIDQSIIAARNCPEKYPKYNKIKLRCQACASHEIFNKIQKTCQRNNNIGFCPPQTPIYNYQSHICEPCPQGQVFNTQIYDCQNV